MQKQLQLSKLPLHIESFDNSNLQGSDAVAGCIVFKNGKPSKKEYRRFIIQSVIGPDDYASMKEVVKRRYKRLQEEKGPLPDLILTDGGKGQMEAVRKAVEDELNLSIPIAGMVKDSKHRTSELLYGFPAQTIKIKPDGQLFKFLEQVQNEVHRYAITFHKEKRSKRQIASQLDSIKGIGEKTKETLLKEFKSVKRIKEVTIEQLETIVGKAKAELLWNNLHAEENK